MVRTTRELILDWCKNGISKGKKYMVVLCDTWDYEDYPCYFDTKEETINLINNPGRMQRHMESYNLTGDIDKQLNMTRSHIDFV